MLRRSLSRSSGHYGAATVAINPRTSVTPKPSSCFVTVGREGGRAKRFVRRRHLKKEMTLSLRLSSLPSSEHTHRFYVTDASTDDSGTTRTSSTVRTADGKTASAVTEEWDQFIDSLRMNRTPLGTMTARQWKDSYATLAFLSSSFLTPRNHTSAATNNNRNPTNDNSRHHPGPGRPLHPHPFPRLPGPSLDAADRLLQRLVLEYATQSAPARQQPLRALAPWLPTVLQGWLQSSSNNSSSGEILPPTPLPPSKLVAIRAGALWRHIVQWKQRGWWLAGDDGSAGNSSSSSSNNHNDDIDHILWTDAALFRGVLEAWLNLQSPTGAVQAANLLLLSVPAFSRSTNRHNSNNNNNSKSNNNSGTELMIPVSERHYLVPCFQQAVQQCAIYLGNGNSGGICSIDKGRGANEEDGDAILSALLTRIKLLEEKTGWEGLQSIIPPEENNNNNNNKQQQYSQQRQQQRVLDESSNTFPLGGAFQGDDGGYRETEVLSFEAARLHQRMLDMVHNANSPDDRDVIQQRVLERWGFAPNYRSGSIISTTADATLGFALVDYFVRIHDAQEATFWLQKLDQFYQKQRNQKQIGETAIIIEPEQLLRSIRDVIEAWCSYDVRHHTEAPWRADELFRRMRDLLSSSSLVIAAETATKTDVNVCSECAVMVANIWLQSGDAGASQKILHILASQSSLKPTTNATNTALLQAAIESLIEDPTLDSTNVAQTLNFFVKNFPEMRDSGTAATLTAPETMDPPALAEQMIKLLFKNQQQGSDKNDVIQLIRFLYRQRVPLSTTVSELACRSFSYDGASKPDDVVALLDLFSQHDQELSFACYQSAVLALVDMRQQKRIGHTKQILKRLFAAIRDGRLQQVDPKEVGSLIHTVLAMVRYVQHERHAWDILELAETTLMSENGPEFGPAAIVTSNDTGTTGVSPVSLDCYKEVLMILIIKKELEKVEQVFHRVRGYYQAGYTDLLPDSHFYSYYFTALAKMKGSLQNTIDKQEEALNNLIELYADTGNVKCKPMDKMFNGLLVNLLAVKPKTAEQADKALSLLDRMISLHVEFHDDYSFRAAILLQLNNRKHADAFPAVLRVYQQMVDSGGGESVIHPPEYDASWELILSACARAPKQYREKALMAGLATTAELRRKNAMHNRYPLLFQVLRNTLSNGVGDSNSNKDTTQRREAILETAFQSCCEDGCLSRSVREFVENHCSSELWDRMYTRNLLQPGNREPSEWRRHVAVDQGKVKSSDQALRTIR